MSIQSPDTFIQNVPVPVTGSGIAGTPAADVYSVQGISSGTPVPVSGTVTTTLPVSNTASVTQVVVANNTNVTVLAANANRKGAVIFCPSQTLQVKFGPVASATSFTYKVTTANTTITTGIDGLVWTGQVDVFGSGQTVTVTELT